MNKFNIPDKIINNAIKGYQDLENLSKEEFEEFKTKFKNEGTGIRVFKRIIEDKQLTIEELYRIRSIIKKHLKNKDKLSKIFVKIHGGLEMVKFVDKITKDKHVKKLLNNKIKRYFGSGREKRGQGVFSYSKLRLKKSNLLIHFY